MNIKNRIKEQVRGFPVAELLNMKFESLDDWKSLSLRSEPGTFLAVHHILLKIN